LVTQPRDERRIVARAELLSAVLAEQIMSMPAVHRRWTVEEVEQLVDAREGLTPRYELVRGELLVTPAPTPRHQRIVFQLALLLQRYLTTHGIGEVFLGPCELRLATGERYEPDLFVLPAEHGRRPVLHESLVRPILICESLSPDSSRHDRITKRRAFQRNDVPTYWVIDGDAEAFEVWRPGDERPALVDDRLVWRPSETSEPFELDVREFFTSARDAGPLP
jgi:Uma2 family endonuclease